MVFSGKTAIATFKLIQKAKNWGVLENSGYCEAQARIGKGWPSRRKTLKLKHLPRAYIKVVCALSNDTKCMTHFFREAEVTKPPTLAC